MADDCRPFDIIRDTIVKNSILSNPDILVRMVKFLFRERLSKFFDKIRDTGKRFPGIGELS